MAKKIKFSAISLLEIPDKFLAMTLKSCFMDLGSKR